MTPARQRAWTRVRALAEGDVPLELVNALEQLEHYRELLIVVSGFFDDVEDDDERELAELVDDFERRFKSIARALESAVAAQVIAVNRINPQQEK